MSAPIQASASVQVVPASNCVRSRTRMPLRRPGDMGVTVIVELLAFISSDYTLRAPARPHRCWPSASNAIKKSAGWAGDCLCHPGGCGNGAMAEPVRPRQTKGAATDMFAHSHCATFRLYQGVG